MTIALLFDAYAYDDHWNYWWATRERVFSTNIIQDSGRHMRLSVGDVHTGFTRGVDPQAKFEALFERSEWARLIGHRVREAFYHSVVFAMVFENMPTWLAEELHRDLSTEAGYIGAVAVHYEFAPHLARYRVPERYRIAGRSCRGFFVMGEEDGKDEYDLEEMKRLGYTDVGWEDRGGHQTIFDSFDTPAHFRRVAIFKSEVANLLPGGPDDASELVLLLSDLNPQLFNVLGAAFERIAGAETEEEVAQAAISGRRYFEQLANALFPAISDPRRGRSLGPERYRNRLWAFIEDNADGDDQLLMRMGAEVDRLNEELNGGLHGDRPKERILQALTDAAQLTLELVSLNPEDARKPYYAFEKAISNFLRKVITDRAD